jgi:hypothetical protein
MLKTIPINDASATQLAEFAVTNLGLDVTHRLGKDAIRAKMAVTGFDKDTIEIDVPEVSVAKAPVEGAKQRKYVEVMIATEERPGGADPVPVGLNGRVMWIERAKPQRVPREYYQVLLDAVKKVYDPNPAGGLMPARDVPTYPVSLLREVA